VVEKVTDGDTTTARASLLSAEERVVELSRMLSGSPTSDKARGHARELLSAARATTRGGPGSG
jgi:DNA repair protein RecN (Recombination protein N)